MKMVTEKVRVSRATGFNNKSNGFFIFVVGSSMGFLAFSPIVSL